jgi:hypothetical protein
LTALPTGNGSGYIVDVVLHPTRAKDAATMIENITLRIKSSAQG